MFLSTSFWYKLDVAWKERVNLQTGKGTSLEVLLLRQGLVFKAQFSGARKTEL